MIEICQFLFYSWLIMFCRLHIMSGENNKIILVTGGTGLVGQAIKKIVETEEQKQDEKWIFVGSKEANLM